MLISTLYFIVLLRTLVADLAPEVTVTQGKLKGKYRVTKGNRTFSAFEGIPYAHPPIGDLRFKVFENCLIFLLCNKLSFFNNWMILNTF